MRFSTTILQTGADTTGIAVPDHVVEEFAGGKRSGRSRTTFSTRCSGPVGGSS